MDEFAEKSPELLALAMAVTVGGGYLGDVEWWDYHYAEKNPAQLKTIFNALESSDAFKPLALLRTMSKHHGEWVLWTDSSRHHVPSLNHSLLEAAARLAATGRLRAQARGRSARRAARARARPAAMVGAARGEAAVGD